MRVARPSTGEERRRLRDLPAGGFKRVATADIDRAARARHPAARDASAVPGAEVALEAAPEVISEVALAAEAVVAPPALSVTREGAAFQRERPACCGGDTDRKCLGCGQRYCPDCAPDGQGGECKQCRSGPVWTDADVPKGKIKHPGMTRNC